MTFKHQLNSTPETSAHKKALLLLKSIIFHYHGLDKAEQEILNATANAWNAFQELQWATHFIAKDYLTAFDRARKLLNRSFRSIDKSEKLSYLKRVWKLNQQKGYITEIEATALLKIAKDWEVESELISMVRSQI